MVIHPEIENAYRRVTDAAFARLPRRVPSIDRLRACRIISHRGEYDNRHILENTPAAFERAAAAGVWAVECDIRWTRDDVPVVHHDPDLRRLFGSSARLEQIPWRSLRAEFGAVPALSDVVARFGGRLHLMIEIKGGRSSDQARRTACLEQALAPLRPVRDYHIMSLDAPREAAPPFLPKQALVAIAYTWPERLSRWVLAHGWGGLCGHYLLMHRAIVRRHQRRGQVVGTGFVGSRNCLFRELNRGVNWIFSDNAAALQQILNIAIEKGY